MPHPLRDKRALIGGGSRGIGLGCAIALSEAGSAVTLMARDLTSLKKAAASLPTPIGQAHAYITLDSADWRAVQEQVRAELDSHGPIEILIHNTGGPPPGHAADASPELFDTAFDMHVLTGQVLVQSVVPGMKDVGYGRIINILSSSVVTPLPNLGVSNTIRGAVAQWGRSLASELAPHGITVNNILPGSIDTARLRSTMARTAERAGMSLEEVEASTLAGIPMGRLGTPEDIGRVAAFLASPAASYVTGANVPVDGGKTAVQ